MNAYLAQLEKPFRASAEPLARDPIFLARFEQAQIALADYFRSADADEARAYPTAINACVAAVSAAREAAPVLAELQGEQRFARQIFAFVLYRVVEASGGTELAREFYRNYTPRSIAGRADLRALRDALGMAQPPGRTPGHEVADKELLARLSTAAQRVAHSGDLITVAKLADDMAIEIVDREDKAIAKIVAEHPQYFETPGRPLAT